MPPPPKPILIASAILGVVLIASAAMRIVQGVGANPPYYYMVGFECLSLVAGVFAVLLGRGRFAEGPGLTLLSVAAVTLVASVVSYSTSQGRPLYDLAMLRDPFTAARIALAALFAALAAAAVLVRRPSVSIRRLAWGAVWTGVAFAIVAPAVLPQGKAILASMHPMVRMLGAVFGFLFFVGFLSAGLHFLIRAFEAGRLEEPAEARAG